MKMTKTAEGCKNTLVEEEQEFLRTADFEESFDGDKKSQWQVEGTSRKKKPRSASSKVIAEFRRFRWLIDALLLLVNISLSIMLLGAFRSETSSSSIQVGGDFSGTGPDCKFAFSNVDAGHRTYARIVPTKVVKFAANEAFVPKNAQSSSRTVSSQRGTPCSPVCLPGSNIARLLTLLVNAGWGSITEFPFFTTSMTHQLHCVVRNPLP
jgi:hypothetical protein